MDITAISDLHGYYPKLDGGDLLILAGDYTTRDEIEQWEDFYQFLDAQPYEWKVVIAGNHDNNIDPDTIRCLSNKTYYLENSLCEINGLKIWGTPHSLLFDGVNPKCTAFMKTEEELEEIYSHIPKDIDILISHTPPYGILDRSFNDEHCGSKSLNKATIRILPRFLICGHIHEEGNKEQYLGMTKVINCSYVNERYRPVNKPIRVEI